MAGGDDHQLKDFLLNHPQFRRSRLPSLFSDFRSLAYNNPDGYSANVAAWKSFLTDAVREGLIASDGGGVSKLTLSTGPSLLHSLEIPEWKRPLALGAVVQEAVKDGDFIELKDFLDRRESIYWEGGWLARLSNVVKWGLGKTGVFGGDLYGVYSGDGAVVLSAGKWVIMENLDKVAGGVLGEVARRAGSSSVARIMNVEMFVREVLGKVLLRVGRASGTVSNETLDAPLEYAEERNAASKTDIDILLKYLSRDLGELEISGTTLKFKIPNAPLTPITPADTTLAQLRSTVLTLDLHLDMLSTRISQLDSRAHSALQTGNKTLALSFLRSKKLTEETLRKRTDMLHQLETVLNSIEEAGSNLEHIHLIEQSSKVLYQLNKEVGGIERVEDAMEKLREGMMDTEEISRVIAEGEPTVDEVELEDELEEMLKEETEKRIIIERKQKAQAAVAVATKDHVEQEQEERLRKTIGSLTLEDQRQMGEPNEAVMLDYSV